MSARVTVLACALAMACGGDDDPVPAAIAVSAEPQRLFYHTGQPVTLIGTVFDGRGTVIEGAAVDWTVDPPSAAVLSMPPDGSSAPFMLLDVGRVTFTGCAVVEPALCDSLTVAVDDGSPALEVTSPRPGAQLDDPAGIVVAGSVADGTGSLTVFVDGVAVATDAMGRFETTIAPRFGVHHVEVIASDGRTAVSAVEMDVQWAPAYTPARDAAGSAAFRVDDGLGLFLGQRFFDDEAPFDPRTAPVVTRDLADLIELVVARADVTSMLPDPVVDSRPTLFLRIPAATIDEPRADLSIRDDGLDLLFRGRLQVETEGLVQVDTEMLDLEGTVTASAAAYLHLTVTKDSEEAEVQVGVADLAVGLETLDGSFVDPEVGAVFRLASTELRMVLEREASDAVADLLSESVPALLQDVLSGLDHALEDQTVTLDQPPVGAVVLSIRGRVSRIVTGHRWLMLAPLSLSVSATGGAHDSRGIARLAASETVPEYFRGGSVELGIKLALLNGLLHVLWDGGLMDMDLTSQLPESVTGLVRGATVTPKLPPLLRAPRADDAMDVEHDLILTLGQLELVVDLPDGEVPSRSARFGVRLQAGVDVTLLDNVLSIAVSEDLQIAVWTIERPADERLVTRELVASVLQSAWPDLRGTLTEGLSLDLPIPPPTGIERFAPSLSMLTLSISETDPRLYPRDQVLLLDAELVGRAP